MKNLVVFSFAFFCVNFIVAQKSIKIQVEIANRNGDEIYVNSVESKIRKIIKVDKNGIFTSIFSGNAGMYTISDGINTTNVFLNLGFDLIIKADAKRFQQTLTFLGKGEKENNFLLQNSKKDDNEDEMFSLDKFDFLKSLEKKNRNDLDYLAQLELDPKFIALQKKQIDLKMSDIDYVYDAKHFIVGLINTPSPVFDFQNITGTNTKSEAFLGKYIYCNIWATTDLKSQEDLTDLKILQDKYKEKNIEFISISIDDFADFEKWRFFIKNRNLGGTHLFADRAWESDFIASYAVTTIPRYILIDKSGMIIDAEAEKPSSLKLIERLDTLLNQ